MDGFDPPYEPKFGMLDDYTVTFDGVEYTINIVLITYEAGTPGEPDHRWNFGIYSDPELPLDTELTVDGLLFVLDQDAQDASSGYRWEPPPYSTDQLGWVVDQKVTLSLTFPTSATGEPSIAGVAQAGETLTGGIGDVDDVNGLPANFPRDYELQWVRVDSNDVVTSIPGATSLTYVPTADDVGTLLHLRVSFTDLANESELVTSQSTLPVLPAAESCSTDRADANWCSTMTVGNTFVGTTLTYGYHRFDGLGSLDDDSFFYGGTTFAIKELLFLDDTNSNEVALVVDAFLPRGSIFNFGGMDFVASADSEDSVTEGHYNWTITDDFGWRRSGQRVTVSANLTPLVVVDSVRGGLLTLTYAELLDPNAVPPASAFAIKIDGGTPVEPTDVSVSGATLTLTLPDPVTADEDVTLTYVMPPSNPLQDTSGLEAPEFSDHTVTNNSVPNVPATGEVVVIGTPQANQKLMADISGIVDGNGRRKANQGEPGFAFNYRWVRYDDDGQSNPEELQQGTDDSYELDDDDVGKVVRVEVTYTDDDGYPETFTGEAANTIAEAGFPLFDDGAQTTRSIQENLADATETSARNVGAPVRATDPDPGDTLEYSLEGDDSAKFTINTSTGQLRTVVGETYDHEANASFSVVVRATDGTNASTVAVTVEIEDRDEPPLVPGSLTVTADADSASRIEVSWEAPSNTGRPTIDGYDVSYRTGSGSWTDGPQGVTETKGTLTGLTASTTYQVRVRASNAEGDSAWTASRSAQTVAPSVSFGSAVYTAIEGAAGALVTVQLEAPLTNQVQISLNATPQNGATTADYSGIPSSVTFAAGDTSKTFTVTATADVDEDDTESVLIEFISLPASVREGKPATATVALVATEVTIWYVSFEHRNYTVDEGGTGVTVKAQLNAPWKPKRNKTLIVPLLVSERGGTDENDYDGVPDNVSFAPGVTEATFIITATENDEDDDNKSLLLRFDHHDIKDLEGSPNAPDQTIVRLRDNDGLTPIGVRFGASVYEAVEGGAPAKVKVLLSKTPDRELTIPITHETHNETHPWDYSGVPDHLVFSESETEKTFEVVAEDDHYRRTLQYLTISFGDLPKRVSTSKPKSTTVNLKDDDGGNANVIVAFDTRDTYELTEGDGQLVYVYASTHPADRLSVPIEVEHIGGATGADYGGVPTTVTIDKTDSLGRQYGRFGVSIRQDSESGETGEGIRLKFGKLPQGVSVHEGRASRVFMILDDDGFPAVGVEGERAREGSNPQQYVDFQIKLDHKAEYEVKVDYATVERSAKANQDFLAEAGTLTFKPGETSKTVSVFVCNDGIPEPHSERLFMQLSNPVRAVLKDNGRGIGEIRDSEETLTPKPCSTGAWIEGGEVPETRQIFNLPIRRAELEFKIHLNRPAQEKATVTYATFDGTATAGEDYDAKNGTVTFYVGQQTKTVKVLISHDDHDEGEETVGMRITGSTGAYIGLDETYGTIENSGPMPQAWLSRFGRAAADNALDAIGRRLRDDPDQPTETHVTFAGRRIDALFTQRAGTTHEGMELGDETRERDPHVDTGEARQPLHRNDGSYDDDASDRTDRAYGEIGPGRQASLFCDGYASMRNDSMTLGHSVGTTPSGGARSPDLFGDPMRTYSQHGLGSWCRRRHVPIRRDLGLACSSRYGR